MIAKGLITQRANDEHLPAQIRRAIGFYGVLLYTGLLDIPEHVLEPARLDGAAGWKLIRNIVLPLSTPVLLAVIFSINGTLKVLDSIYALTIPVQMILLPLFTVSLGTVQLGLLNFTGQYRTIQYGPPFAAICINIFGLLMLYIILDKRVMGGLSAGAVKAELAPRRPRRSVADRSGADGPGTSQETDRRKW